MSYCRTREEIQEMRQTRDPITSLREKLVSSKLAEADELKKIELDVRKMVIFSKLLGDIPLTRLKDLNVMLKKLDEIHNIFLLTFYTG